ncbi:hypothetical protein HanHA89_Chr12g0462861 [Helianthus annuus]|nr:hypothetical protein HanHA89_Chr12g0462861 [Helianthus annuus]
MEILGRRILFNFPAVFNCLRGLCWCMFYDNSLIACLFNLWIFCIGLSILVSELFLCNGLGEWPSPDQSPCAKLVL